MIIRAKKQRRFTTVDNAPFQDKRLHWDTRGLLAYLLTKPDGWEIRIEDLLKQEEPEDGSRVTGREKVFRMLRELKTYGYLHRMQVNGANGRFETVCEVYENPGDNPYFAANGEDAEPQAFPELEEGQKGQTVVGKAAHGKAVVGKAVHGKAVYGSAVDGFADRIVSTDLESKDGEESKDRQREKTDGTTPPHLRGWDALHGNGLTPEEQRVMNDIRAAFGFHNAEEALDATRSLLAAGIMEWGQDQQLLLDTLRRVAKGVAPATTFRDWLALWRQGAEPDELIRLFGRNRDTSWWVNASGMNGMPWPSQVANNLLVAREWETMPDVTVGQNGRAGTPQTTQAISSLQRYAERVQQQGHGDRQ